MIGFVPLERNPEAALRNTDDLSERGVEQMPERLVSQLRYVGSYWWWKGGARGAASG